MEIEAGCCEQSGGLLCEREMTGTVEHTAGGREHGSGTRVNETAPREGTCVSLGNDPLRSWAASLRTPQPSGANTLILGGIRFCLLSLTWPQIYER